jgi:hypothetical protein
MGVGTPGTAMATAPTIVREPHKRRSEQDKRRSINTLDLRSRTSCLANMTRRYMILRIGATAQRTSFQSITRIGTDGTQLVSHGRTNHHARQGPPGCQGERHGSAVL